MADASSVTSSSVAPGDSASSRGKKNKPGKRERAEARAVRQGSGAPASAAKAAIFSAGAVSDPVPQPGKFPIVFQTGAGEPSRDKHFAYSGDTIGGLTNRLFDQYRFNDRFAEFKANSDLTTDQFGTYVAMSMVLGLAQQTVHSHVNMGFPLGDFSPLNSSDVAVFSAIRAQLSQFGEYSVPALGTRYVLKDYPCEIRKLVRFAHATFSGSRAAAASRYWLPASNNDGSFKLCVASRLRVLLERYDLSVSSTVLEEAVLSGDVPDAWETVKTVLGDAPGEGEADPRDRFDFLFKSYGTEGQFTVGFSTESAASALQELGLAWENPSAGHLRWDLNVKEMFGILADKWSKMTPTFEKFFSMSSGLANRSAASGGPGQMVEVRTSDSVTVVRAVVALSAPEFSLSACFPPTGVYSGGLERLVVLTTPLNVAQRATEFCQLDWK